MRIQDVTDVVRIRLALRSSDGCGDMFPECHTMVTAANFPEEVRPRTYPDKRAHRNTAGLHGQAMDGTVKRGLAVGACLHGLTS